MLRIYSIATFLLLGLVLAQSQDTNSDNAQGTKLSDDNLGLLKRLGVFGSRRNDGRRAEDAADDSRNTRRRNPNKGGNAFDIDTDGMSDDEALEMINSEIDRLNSENGGDLIDLEIVPNDAYLSDSAGPRGSRSRGFLKGIFKGLGSGYKGFRKWETAAATVVNDAISDTFNGLTYVFDRIPYEQIGETALRAGAYFADILDTGIPAEALNTLLTTSAGDPKATISILMDPSKTAEELGPIMVEIGENYKSVFATTALELESLVSVLTNGAVPVEEDEEELIGFDVAEEMYTLPPKSDNTTGEEDVVATDGMQ